MRGELVLAAVMAVLALILMGCADSGQRAAQPPADTGRRPVPPETELARINAVLDDFHDAAAHADFSRYFGHFARDGVFLGTDASERWTVEQFKAYVKPYFDQGKGWRYVPRPRGRHVAIRAQVSGREAEPVTAWFDEVVDNEKYGECRGTGVLVQEDGAWKIAQYNLTVPVPNELLPKVVEMIRAMPAKK